MGGRTGVLTLPPPAYLPRPIVTISGPTDLFLISLHGLFFFFPLFFRSKYSILFQRRLLATFNSKIWWEVENSFFFFFKSILNSHFFFLQYRGVTYRFSTSSSVLEDNILELFDDDRICIPAQNWVNLDDGNYTFEIVATSQLFKRDSEPASFTFFLSQDIPLVRSTSVDLREKKQDLSEIGLECYNLWDTQVFFFFFFFAFPLLLGLTLLSSCFMLSKPIPLATPISQPAFETSGL